MADMHQIRLYQSTWPMARDLCTMGAWGIMTELHGENLPYAIEVAII